MPDSKSLKIETNVAIAMRDGVTLYADIYRPNGDGPFPTILQRTPYDKTNALSASTCPLCAAGNAAVQPLLSFSTVGHPNSPNNRSASTCPSCTT